MKDPIENFPIFIPALTIVKNMHNYEELLNLLLNSETESIMLSAFDLSKKFNDLNPLVEEIKNHREKVFFLDSGGFEKFNIPYFNGDWKIDDLISIIEKIRPDIIVAYDKIVNNIEQAKSDIISSFLNTIKLSEKMVSVEKKFEVVIHSQDIEKIFSILQDLKEYDKNIYAISIPERNLGYSINIRLVLVKQITNYIKNNLNWKNIHIHLMGCSDPLLMIEYAHLGIDIFDGVHWQDLIINPLNNMFQDYSNLLNINCKCPYCTKFGDLINQNYNYEEEFYNYYAINHNLYFYKNLWRD